MRTGMSPSHCRRTLRPPIRRSDRTPNWTRTPPLGYPLGINPRLTAKITRIYAADNSVDQLPEDTLVYLLQSRYCDTEKLSNIAWSLFGNTRPGWARVQAVCDFVHGHLTFGYPFALATRTAFEAYQERKGVCRDFAHLALTLCRCLNIPARYCTGYLGDIGVPPVDAPMDFSGWFEAFLDGGWYTFDARHNVPRIGRVLIARGRDAADVAISMTFGPCILQSFQVWTDEVH
jgi:transglutaminase-like putative cysteine protease